MDMRVVTPTWRPPKDTRFRRRLLYVRHLINEALVINHDFPLCTLGDKSTGCSWTFCPDGLGPQSVVYSGGVGNDITFEHALVNKFGCSMTLLDPSPTGLATMKLPENQIPQFRFAAFGLAGDCGTLRLAPPLQSDEGSWFSHDTSDRAIEFACKDLTSLMRENDHQHIDLLKLDIEGSEYGVIDDLLGRKIPVQQILVEFHHDLLPGFSLRQSVKSAYRLMRAGYKMIAEVGTCYTFIKRST